jgi:hypothetical protein
MSGISGVIWVIVLMLLCGFGDAQGFIYASKIWQVEHFSWADAAKSALGFQFGQTMYWLALRDLKTMGVASSETQTIIWFVATIIGVAALSGQLFRWQAVDQFVAAVVLCGVGWLLMRTAC